MNWTALWPTLIGLLPLVTSVFSDVAANFLATHPTLYALVVAVNVAIANVVTAKKPA